MVVYHNIAIARTEVIQHSSIRKQHIALLSSLASAIAGIASLTQITCTACVFEVGSRKSRQSIIGNSMFTYVQVAQAVCSKFISRQKIIFKMSKGNGTPNIYQRCVR